jgi:hypothetical protein
MSINASDSSSSTLFRTIFSYFCSYIYIMHNSRGRVVCTAFSCEINVNIPAKDFEMVLDGTETDKLTCKNM